MALDFGPTTSTTTTKLFISAVAKLGDPQRSKGGWATPEQKGRTLGGFLSAKMGAEDRRDAVSPKSRSDPRARTLKDGLITSGHYGR